jgi:hypothetical protein
LPEARNGGPDGKGRGVLIERADDQLQILATDPAYQRQNRRQRLLLASLA